MEMVILQRVTKFLHFVSSLFGCLFIYLFFSIIMMILHILQTNNYTLKNK